MNGISWLIRAKLRSPAKVSAATCGGQSSVPAKMGRMNLSATTLQHFTHSALASARQNRKAAPHAPCAPRHRDRILQ